MIEFLKKWLNKPSQPTADQRRKAAIRKSHAKIKWQVSQADSKASYFDPNSEYDISFTPNVINSFGEFVKDQEQNNPEWSSWVAEWESKEFVKDQQQINPEHVAVWDSLDD